MALIKVQSTINQRGLPTISFNKSSGRIHISSAFFEATKIQQIKCGFYKSDTDRRDWYICFHADENIPLKKINDTGIINAKQVCIDMERCGLSGNGKYQISTTSIKIDDMEVYPIITRKCLK